MVQTNPGCQQLRRTRAPMPADVFHTRLRDAGGVPGTDAAAEALHHAIRAIRTEHPRSPSLWAAHLRAGA